MANVDTKARKGQFWKDSNDNYICVRSTRNDKITFTHLGGKRGHNLFCRAFYKTYEYVSSMSGKQFKKGRDITNEQCDI